VSRRNEARAKGFWPIDVYEDYIEKHASPAERRDLLDPRGERDQDYPNIVVANDSMAEWMAFNTIVSLNDRDLNFRRLTETYRLETKQHIFAVRSWLAQMKQWATGRALLKEIRSSDAMDVRIVPYRGRGRQAYTNMEDEVAGTAKWRLVNPYKFGDLRTGTGIGSDALIEFTPGAFQGPDMRLPGQAPDEVLFHELVHASRIMRGVYRSDFVNKEYDEYEEYVAIVVANIYLSEKGQWTLKGDHDSSRYGARLKGKRLDDFMNNSQGINLPPMQLMDEFKAAQPDFYRDLSNLPRERPRYNWVRIHKERRDFQEFTRPRDRTGIF
jgi:NleD-like pathogen effector protein (putative zinc metallopeptidase)